MIRGRDGYWHGVRVGVVPHGIVTRQLVGWINNVEAICKKANYILVCIQSYQWRQRENGASILVGRIRISVCVTC